ncbi:putative Chromosome partition protein Smc [Candidatus Zixiibacteriota bacterium]|nr:putative Chromosome partition protein Smc [candidate division Zixibacteria bacterium]
MYLKRLELLGFKSFPDKTIIKLTKGIISIVGPNGCGKTNILDSIRWVLGEQKVSLLRGSKMEEIIFNGTRDIKPLGMAEVTLVIQNDRGVLPTEYGEVQITRRLFRSGDSEYLLNKIPCRLKDIADLLMDTGIGAHVYSVIQQDMIDAILSDRADDRRFLFEEAAGISKYKSRKKAAIRKLEATEQDLLRLKDIVAEVNTQVNSLNRQMKKAERYQKMAEELKAWEIFLSKGAFTELKHERKDCLAERESLLDIRQKHDTDIDSLSARQEEERNRLTDIDKQLAEIAARLFEHSEQAHELEKEISVLQQKRENSRQLKDRNLLDIEAFKRRKENLFEQIGESERALVALEEQLSGITEQLSHSATYQVDADEEVLVARRSREELNQQMLALEGRLSADKSSDSNLKEQEIDITDALTRQEESLAGMSVKRSELEKHLKDSEDSRGAFLSQLEMARENRSAMEAEITALLARSEELSGEIFESTASFEAAEARRHLLQEMMIHYEGYSPGAAATLAESQKWPGLIGTIADSLTPVSGFENAIESALGEIAGFMICRDRETAGDIINYLRAEKKGKAGLVILDECRSEETVNRPEFQPESVQGWADEYVTVNAELAPLVKLLLSRTAVVKAEAAPEVVRHLPLYFSAVTLEGQLFHSQAIISGGSTEGFSLFGRKEKIAEQEKIISELNRQIEKAKVDRTEVTTRLASIQGALRDAIAEIEKFEVQLENIDKELTSKHYEIQTVVSEIHRIEKEKGTYQDKLDLLRNRQYNLTLNYDSLTQEKEELLKRLENQNQLIQEKERKSEELQSRISELQIGQIELKSQKQQAESQIRHTRELISEIDINAERKTREIAVSELEIAEAVDKIKALEVDLKGMFEARTVIDEKQLAMRQIHSEISGHLDGREKEIKSIRTAREEVLNKLHTTELRLTEIEAETKNLLEKIRDEYDLDLEQAAAPIPDDSITEDRRQERVHELKEAMKNFGGVNLLAIEEYHSAKERQEFLGAQLNDLLNAKSTLQSTITKINVTAKNLFIETFGKVRENFQKVFQELFSGGESDIRLVDPEDPLESPIEIIVRPRGKKLLSIAQMSGGERAMTAISLLFAIYLVKPSPFCIFDEIDAPLDDANIHRFLKMIRTFSDTTQFIIITHNKITMEAADVLYGVTMETPGISKVVSVRFNRDADEPLVNTALIDSEPAREIELPAAIRERLTSHVKIDSGGDDEFDS